MVNNLHEHRGTENTRGEATDNEMRLAQAPVAAVAPAVSAQVTVTEPPVELGRIESRKRFLWKSWMVALPAALMLGGCGLPPAVVVASYALDGWSFMVSGKSVSDHAISFALKKDCSMFRVIAGKEICQEPNDDASRATEVAIALQNNNWNVDLAPPEAAGQWLDLAGPLLTFGSQSAVFVPSITGLPHWESRPQPAARFTLLALDGPAASPLADFIGLEQTFAGHDPTGAVTTGGNVRVLACTVDWPLWSTGARKAMSPSAPERAASASVGGYG